MEQIRCCNCCGKKIEIKNRRLQEDFLYVRKEWDFFSKKDGQIHSFYICEDCYDQWISKFTLPVHIEEQTELL